MLLAPPTTRAGLYRRSLLDQTVSLRNGQEWDLGPVLLRQGLTYEIAWTGTVRSYVGIFSTVEHAAMRRRGGPTPFPFGSDRVQHARQLRPRPDGWYVVVVRVGVFNPPGDVRVGLYQI